MNITLNNLTFRYSDNEELFNGHNLRLDSPQGFGLYGIIGPSGTGKTTLLSILGGQLHPEGEVSVNGIEIYSVPDVRRRQLLALQIQTSTSLRGKLEYNLRFGLPRNKDIYSDKDLVKVLKRVGLWELFEHKKGLDTLIGEGGLNLSGGQRQRLNFANLYLRAKHFNPKLILVDEPTSSLDEVSERAITQMIRELSQSSVTFVVAHRLVTLNEAIGLLDSSLFSSSTTMQFMSKQDLHQVSQYYRDLTSGRAQLED
jgi:ABC-type multidrug transport system fused ATPase/permease subunit